MTTPELPPLPEPHGYIADGRPDGLEFRRQRFTEIDALFRSIEPVFSAPDMHAYARTALAPLEAEVAAMRKDAARFQWLEAHGDHGINFMTGVFRTEFQAQAFRTAGGTMLRAAIDSAMNTKGESA